MEFCFSPLYKPLFIIVIPLKKILESLQDKNRLIKALQNRVDGAVVANLRKILPGKRPEDFSIDSQTYKDLVQLARTGDYNLLDKIRKEIGIPEPGTTQVDPVTGRMVPKGASASASKGTVPKQTDDGFPILRATNIIKATRNFRLILTKGGPKDMRMTNQYVVARYNEDPNDRTGRGTTPHWSQDYYGMFDDINDANKEFEVIGKAWDATDAASGKVF